MTAKDIWDAKTYLQFEDERLRPALDLIARIPHEAPKLVVDLGCGAGNALPVLAARFPDLAVKYEGIAYALMLKHVGVLQATIAYTATAMGLGAVPIGTGDSDSFAAATGLDYYRHGSIGEIALSMPADS